MVNAREMKKILRDNGYEYQRCKGSHFIYSNGVNTIAVNRTLTVWWQEDCSSSIIYRLRNNDTTKYDKNLA